MTTYTDRRISRTSKFLLYGAVIVTLAVLSGGPSPHAQSGAFSPRLTKPRVAPIPEQGRDEAQRQMLASRPDYNVYKTLAAHPELFSRWSGLGRFVMNGSSLPARHREMLMLRMGWLCQSEYEWAQHARIATSDAGMTDQEIQHPRLYAPHASFGTYLRSETSLPPRTRELLIMRTAYLIGAEYEWSHHVERARAAGLTEREISRIAAGPDAAGWSEESRAVLRAADELRREAFISDRTWGVLAKRYNTKQLIEIVFTVGGYTMTGLAINSFGIQTEPGYPAFPRSKRKDASPHRASLGE